MQCVGGCSTKLVSTRIASQIWLQSTPHMTAAATAAGLAGAAAGSGRCRPAAMLQGRRRRCSRAPGCPAAAVLTLPTRKGQELVSSCSGTGPVLTVLTMSSKPCSSDRYVNRPAVASVQSSSSFSDIQLLSLQQLRRGYKLGCGAWHCIVKAFRASTSLAYEHHGWAGRYWSSAGLIHEPAIKHLRRLHT